MNTYRARADVLRVMAHPVRLRILDMLQGESECVCHLSAALGKPQPYVSQQLAVLRKAGLVVDEREGANSFYRLADTLVSRQVRAILGFAQDRPDESETVCHQAIDGCICPKCRHADVRSLDGLSSPC
jgi:DNA-binding transcriptional ArsR family regulator